MKKNTPHVRFERVEERTLFSSLNVSDFGAIADDSRDDRSAIEAAIRAAKSGDQIHFDAGTYNINGSITLKSGIEFDGAKGTWLDFKTANNQFAIRIESGAQNVAIHGFHIRANCGGILADGFVKNLEITDNEFVWGYDGTYYNRLAIRSMRGSDGLIIERNGFNNSLSSDRAVDLSDVSNGSYSYNSFYRINDGGHVDGRTRNFRFVGNRGEQIHRMGLELQDHGTTDNSRGENIVIADNVFTNWYKPYWDSFGLSIMPQRANNVSISGNYISALDQVDGWGIKDSGGANRFGYAIEAGFTSGIVENNVLGGNWVQCVSASMKNTPIRNNLAFGTHAWGTFSGEPGLLGFGSVSDQGGNVIDRDNKKIPAAPTLSQAPTVERDAGNSIVEPNADGMTYLSDLQIASAISGWGEVELDSSNGERDAGDGNMITLDGKRYRKGLGVAVDSEITLDLAGRYDTFFSRIGIDDEVGDKGSMTFEVYADGEKIYESGVLSGDSSAKSVEVDVRGVSELKLVTTDAGDGANSDHGNWANARLSVS